MRITASTDTTEEQASSPNTVSLKVMHLKRKKKKKTIIQQKRRHPRREETWSSAQKTQSRQHQSSETQTNITQHLSRGGLGVRGGGAG